MGACETGSCGAGPPYAAIRFAGAHAGNVWTGISTTRSLIDAGDGLSSRGLRLLRARCFVISPHWAAMSLEMKSHRSNPVFAPGLTTTHTWPSLLAAKPTASRQFPPSLRKAFHAATTLLSASGGGHPLMGVRPMFRASRASTAVLMGAFIVLSPFPWGFHPLESQLSLLTNIMP